MAYDPNLAYNMRVQQAQQAADRAYRQQLSQLYQQARGSGNYSDVYSLLEQGGNQLPAQNPHQQPQQQSGWSLFGALSGNGQQQNSTDPFSNQGMTGLYPGLLGFLGPNAAANSMFSQYHAAPVQVEHVSGGTQPTGSLIGTFNNPAANLQGFNNPAANLQGFNNPAQNYQGANDPAKNMTGGPAVPDAKMSINTGIAMGK
ncbi:hypothetical protein [Burkholderia vietnamiensis]|uniref:hypothetical protein n=1 Tax=Burkholderia vietnamiensis TaxID=60552 RepID=UPI0012D972FD|nr:hypothetical protein [Burkholderia vietnamiensis]